MSPKHGGLRVCDAVASHRVVDGTGPPIKTARTCAHATSRGAVAAVSCDWPHWHGRAGRPPRQSRYICGQKQACDRAWPWARGGGGAIGNSRESTRSGKDADSPWRLCATHIAALLPDHTVPRTLACCPNMGQVVACGRCLPQTAPRPGKMAGALRPSTFSPRARTPPRSARSVRKRRISGRSARTRVRSRGGRDEDAEDALGQARLPRQALLTKSASTSTKRSESVIRRRRRPRLRGRSPSASLKTSLSLY
jgi:hypothetical protein